MDILNEKVTEVAVNLNGGILACGFKNLKNGETFFHNESHIFPAASIVKIPIFLEYLRQKESGIIDPNKMIKIKKEDVVGGAGIIFELHEGVEFTVADLARLMMVISDNTASNIMLDITGMDNVNAFIKFAGLSDTVIGRKFMIDPNTKFAMNFTSARDMVKLLDGLFSGRLLSEEATREALETMSRQQYREKIPLLLPEKLKIANKTGEISGVRHDCAIVLDGNDPFILCFLTEKLPDVNAGNNLIAQTAKFFYDYVKGKLSLR